MLETSCLDEAQKNKRAEWGIGAHLRWALLWFKWRKWLPSSTMIQRPSALNFNHPITFTSMLSYGAVTVKHPKANKFMFARTSCLGMLELVMWTKCRLGANPELHGRSFLDFGVRGVCLSWMNKKQTFCQFLWASSWAAPKHVWCIQNAGGGAFLNFT